MPGIFHRVDGHWQLASVGASPSRLRLDPVAIEPGERAVEKSCLLVRIDGAGGGPDAWAALVADDADLRHNGAPVVAGLRVLAHRDALGLAGAAPVFFTTEMLASVEAYAGDVAAWCPRCRKQLLAGQAVVRCPSCGVVHHELQGRNCWTYAPTCALCVQPTALDAGLRWTPEDL